MSDRLRPHQHRAVNTVLQGDCGFSAWSRFAELASMGNVFGASVLDACIRTSISALHTKEAEARWGLPLTGVINTISCTTIIQAHDFNDIVADTGIEYEVKFEKIPMPDMHGAFPELPGATVRLRQN